MAMPMTRYTMKTTARIGRSAAAPGGAGAAGAGSDNSDTIGSGTAAAARRSSALHSHSVRPGPRRSTVAPPARPTLGTKPIVTAPARSLDRGRVDTPAGARATCGRVYRPALARRAALTARRASAGHMRTQRALAATFL